MRFLKMATLVAGSLLLSCCVSSLIVGNQLQSRLMWTFIRPLVGFDPNTIHFFDAPIVRNRMTALLGDKYEPVMKLLATANEIQQEGALFYVVSHYAPSPAKAVADAAGLVWNADTNQMAVLLVEGGVRELFSEQVEAGKQAIEPVLPAELRTIYDQAAAAKRAVQAQKQQVDSAKKQLEEADPLLELINQLGKDALDTVN